jgi:hypothetical protein
MDNLTVVGAEDGHLILVSGDGERFSVAINDALTSALRPQHSGGPVRHKASPKEIQAHIRRGLSATQVADLTGEDVSYIEKFEGAVIAEREFVVRQALGLTVARKDGTEVAFRTSVLERLLEIKGTETSWSAWKEETGWMVELAFREGDVEHLARWSFEPKKHSLKPLNDDAQVLSRHEPMPTTLIPKLSAVSNSDQPDRFDSEIFEDSDLGETGPLLEPVPYGRQGEDNGRMADTTDLLEALRKKRGEREAAPEHDPDYSRNAHPSTGGIRLVEDSDDHDASVTPIQGSPDDGGDDPEPTPPSKSKRPQMPSWDDIVFGARGDEDPA